MNVRLRSGGLVWAAGTTPFTIIVNCIRILFVDYSAICFHLLMSCGPLWAAALNVISTAKNNTTAAVPSVPKARVFFIRTGSTVLK